MDEFPEKGTEVASDEQLYRFVTVASFWVSRENRPSSSLFDDPPRVSVNVASLTSIEKCRNQLAVELGSPNGGRVSFNCGQARVLGFDAQYEPEKGNPAHAASLLRFQSNDKAAREEREAARTALYHCHTAAVCVGRETTQALERGRAFLDSNGGQFSLNSAVQHPSANRVVGLADLLLDDQPQAAELRAQRVPRNAQDLGGLDLVALDVLQHRLQDDAVHGGLHAIIDIAAVLPASRSRTMRATSQPPARRPAGRRGPSRT